MTKSLETITVKDVTFVLVPKADYDRMADALDDKLDARAAQRALDEMEGRMDDALTGDEMQAMWAGPLAFWRKRRGLTGARLAEQTGLSHSTISEIETGKTDGGFATLCKLADALAIPVDALRKPRQD